MKLNHFIILMLVPFLWSCGEKAEEENTATENEQTSSSQQTSSPHGQLTWNAPEGWIKETPSSPMRKDEYRIPKEEGDPEDASVVVYYFQGGGGGIQANIERWEEQFVKPEGGTPDATVEEKTVNGLKQTWVDIRGTYLFQPMPMASETTEKPGFRMLAGIVETSMGPWFVKFTGPEKTVTEWEDSFYEFMNSFKE